MPRSREVGPPHRFRDIAKQEFDAWSDSVAREVVFKNGHYQTNRMHPPTGEAGSLPAGWTLVSVCPGMEYQPYHLIRREAGGWVLIRREAGEHGAEFGGAYTCLSDWYNDLQATMATGSVPASGLLVAVTKWIKDELIALYDTADPAERAEQMLLILSGRVRVPPRAAAH